MITLKGKYLTQYMHIDAYKYKHTQYEWEVSLISLRIVYVKFPCKTNIIVLQHTQLGRTLLFMYAVIILQLSWSITKKI